MSLIDVWGFSYQFFEPDVLVEVPIRDSANKNEIATDQTSNLFTFLENTPRVPEQKL